MNTRLKIYLTILIGLATLMLLSGCTTGGSGYYSTGYYRGGSGWYDPYYYRPCCYGGGAVVTPPQGGRPGRPANLPSIRPPQGGRPGRPANLPSIPSRPAPMPRPATRR